MWLKRHSLCSKYSIPIVWFKLFGKSRSTGFIQLCEKRLQISQVLGYSLTQDNIDCAYSESYSGLVSPLMISFIISMGQVAHLSAFINVLPGCQWIFVWLTICKWLGYNGILELTCVTLFISRTHHIKTTVTNTEIVLHRLTSHKEHHWV